MIIGLVITLVSFGISGFVFWKFALPMMKGATRLRKQLADGAAEQRALLATGALGSARILNVQGTGTLINHDPQVVLDLEVHPTMGRLALSHALHLDRVAAPDPARAAGLHRARALRPVEPDARRPRDVRL